MRPFLIHAVILNANIKITSESSDCQGAPEKGVPGKGAPGKRKKIFRHRENVRLQQSSMDKANGKGQQISLDEQSPGERCYRYSPQLGFSDNRLVFDHYFENPCCLSTLRRSVYGWKRFADGSTWFYR